MHGLVQRMATTANTAIKLEFQVDGIEYLVKNFTDDDILVALGEDPDQSDYVLIPSECAQVVAILKRNYLGIKGTSKVTIIPSVDSEKRSDAAVHRYFYI